MAAESLSLERPSSGPLQAILAGALVAGTLDLIWAIGFWAFKGAPAVRILQSIAAGLLGRDAAVEGGWTTGLLGLALHYLIATGMVYAYYFVSRYVAALTQRPVAYGLLYGVFLYFFMNFVVLPLSAAGPAPASVNWPWVLGSIAVHALCVGVPCAWFARLARGRGT